MLLKLPLTESSAKIRTGWPCDDDEDYDLSIWAGVIPFTHRIEAPREDPALRGEIDAPDYVVNYQRLPKGGTTTEPK
jgi:hypothetical protein